MTHQYFVDNILPYRGTSRNKKGEKLFKIQWADKSVTFEPLQHLIDDATYLEDILPVLVEYAAVAKRSPTSKRHCLTCKSRCVHRSLFCNKQKCFLLKKRVENIIS